MHGNFNGKMCVIRSWKIPQSDYFYINQENGFCQDFVDCDGFFGLWGRLQVNKSVTILIQSRQSCCNSVQSSIVKFLYNPVQSIQSKHNWGTHRGIVPKIGISWQLPEAAIPARLQQLNWPSKMGRCKVQTSPNHCLYIFTIRRNREKSFSQSGQIVNELCDCNNGTP